MADLDRIKFVIETLPGARAQVSIDMPAPHPGMRIGTPAHSLALDALGWLGKQPAVAGFVYSPEPAAQNDDQQILLVASGMLQRIGHHAAAAAVLRAMDAGAAQGLPTNPMDWPLPCDVTVGHGTIGKGVALRTLVQRMKGLYKLATGNDADEVAARPPEQRAALLADLQAKLDQGEGA
ncbi:hypothetical protein [Comamonas terrigena]|uniref:hypothetical protein n=1 Tax=Comamonas terrigena TaxID=32013 RepID=UPI0023559400|nr:hypothetical protein [Comamonas terrigena]